MNFIDTVLEDLRHPRVSGRIVKLYSGSKPEPFLCPDEGFQPDQTNCAVFYRCVRASNGKYTVFRVSGFVHVQYIFSFMYNYYYQ